MWRLFLFLAALTFVVSCHSSHKERETKMMVYCAASLSDVISEISSSYETETHSTVKLNIASSGTLARQIENGAQPDIFISANKKWLDYLIEKGNADSASAKRIAGNQMVLVAPVKSKLQPYLFSEKTDLPGLFDDRLSIGDPKHVPAGTYALQILQNLGCAEELEPRFLPAKDARSALMVVELGEVEAGIVYKTDALKSKKIKILTEFPDSLHQPVGYYMALVKGRENDRSLQLYKYIVSEKMKPVWQKYGFEQ